MLDPRPRWGEVGIHGVHRHREWDTVQTVPASAFAGNELDFVVLDDGSPVIERDEPQGSYGGAWQEFADAVRRELEPPFRVRAVRKSSGWAVAGRRIETVELPIEGEQFTFARSGGIPSLHVDGRPSFSGYDELERRVGNRFGEYVVQGRRLSRSTWEIQTAAL